jgi:hypothetical protein
MPAPIRPDSATNLKLADAISIAKRLCTGPERPGCQNYEVRADRVQSSDGHRCVIVWTQASENEIGDFPVPEVQAPPVDTVVPKERTIAFVLQPEVIAQLRAVVTVTKPNASIYLNISEKWRVEVVEYLSEARTKKKEKPARVYIPIAEMGSTWHTDREICVNVRYLLEGIDMVCAPGKAVECCQEDTLDPIVIDGPCGIYIVMPVRI